MDFKDSISKGFYYIEKNGNKSYYTFYIDYTQKHDNVKVLMTDFFNDFYDKYMYENKEIHRFQFLNFYCEKLEQFLI